MWLEFLRGGLTFFGVTLGLAWPLATRLRLAPAEKLLAAVALSLLGTFLFAWGIYVFALPLAALCALPVLAATGMALNRRSLANLLRGDSGRDLVVAQILVTGWCVGWLALVVSYSGGYWVGDWFGHWQRTQFFLERWPRDILFNGFDPLTSRPPLANVVTGAFLAPRPTFAGYQLITTLLGSLAFLPAALLARRFGRRDEPAGGGPAAAILAVLFMLNPLFVQNATFAWTKLPAAFFVLTSLYFFLRAHDADAPPAAGILCAAALAAGILTHYSAGPYAVLLTAFWLVLGWSRRNDPAWRRLTIRAASVAGLVLATWFGWSAAVFGVKRTLLANPSVVDQAPTAAEQAMRVLLNLWDTLVPHFLRTPDFGPLVQTSPWGRWRDCFFQLYQTNLLFAFGSVAWLALVVIAVRDARGATRSQRAFWFTFCAGAVVLGVAVHGARDTFGLTHICLQSLILLGLAWLAARWPQLTPPWRRVLVVGAALDFCLGIALQFGVESGALDRWLTPGRAAPDLVLSYSQFAVMNLRAKLINQWVFLGDFCTAYQGWLYALLGGVFAAAVVRVRNSAPAGTAAPVLPATFRVAAIVAAAGAGAYAWMSWCAFPGWTWNELRLAPAFALRHGVPLYPALDHGPLSTWLYGPVGVLVNLPATLAPSATSALAMAGAINLVVLTLPLAAICFFAGPLRTAGEPVRVLAFALGVLLLPGTSLALQVSDHAAIAFGLLSCMVLAGSPHPAPRRIALAVTLAVIAFWGKQISVFLVPAHVGFLLWQRERSAAVYYMVAATIMGGLSFALNAAVFGLSGLWLNLVEIPARLPWADFGERLSGRLPQLLLLVAAPWPALALLRRKAGWPAPGTELNRLARVLVCAALAMLPIGLFAFFKIGGDLNLLHSWFYLVPVFVLIAVAPESGVGRSPWWPLGLALAVVACRIPDFISLPATPQTNRIAEAELLARANPESIWFPDHPLATFYSDGRLYHVEDGIATRHLAGLPLREASFRAHLPPKLNAVVYPITEPHPFALQLLRDFTERRVAGQWVVYARPDPR